MGVTWNIVVNWVLTKPMPPASVNNVHQLTPEFVVTDVSLTLMKVFKIQELSNISALH